MFSNGVAIHTMVGFIFPNLTTHCFIMLVTKRNSNLFSGADPEVFVGDSVSIRSIIGKIGGTKEHPLPLTMLGDGFAIQEDNVAVEYNIPASGSRQLFVDNITTAMEFIGGVLKDRYNLHFVKDSAVSFPEGELTHPKAHVFGCDPDFNAWTKSVNGFLNVLGIFIKRHTI